MIIRSLLLLPAALLATGAVAFGAPSHDAAPTGFLSHSGTQITFNGAPVRLLGYNMDLAGCSGDYSLQQMEAALAQVVQDSKINAVRVWMFQQQGGPGNWTNFDNLVQAAQAEHVWLFPSLGNEWGNCEPSVTPGILNVHFLSWYQTGYKEANDGYPLSYRDYVKAVAARYANSPAIGEWQLINEPDARNPDNSCNEPVAAQALRAFADDMTGVIKSVDPNHMVGLGAISWCGDWGPDHAYVNAGSVDLCDAIHDYVPIPAMFPRAQADIQACTSINKPAFVGELGICAQITAAGTCADTTSPATLQERASLVNAKMAAYFQAGAAGVFLWYRHGFPPADLGQWEIGPSDPVEAVMAQYAGPPGPSGGATPAPVASTSTPAPPAATSTPIPRAATSTPVPPAATSTPAAQAATSTPVSRAAICIDHHPCVLAVQ